MRGRARAAAGCHSAPGRGFLTHLRVGAFAAGGSLISLVNAIVLSELLGRGLAWGYLWIAVSPVCVGLAVRFGHHAPARGATAVLGRLVSAALLGAALVFAVAFVAATALPGPGRRTESGALLLVAAAGLLLAARVTMPPRIEAPPPDAGAPGIEPPRTGGVLPAAPRGEDAATYAPAAQGPALTLAESERSTLAVEVRLLWGADLIRVEHLDPPRSYHVGESACDVPLGRDLLGAARLALVRADRSGVSAVVPSGVTARVQSGAGRSDTIEGAAGGTAIPLAPDTRVTLTLPARPASAAYRASPGDGEAAPAPLVFEIALVRAGRIVGRELHLGAARRFVVATALAAAAVSGALGLLAAQPAPRADPDQASEAQVAALTRTLQAIAEREEREEEGEESPERRPAPRGWRAPRPQSFDIWPLEDGPYDEVAWLDTFPLFARSYCAARTDPSRVGEPIRSLDQRALYCASPVTTPFGLRALGPPASPDPLGRDVHDLWPLVFTRARDAAGAPPRGTVRLGSPAISGRLPREVVTRIMRQNLGRLRLCYAEGLARDPAITGRLSVRLLVDRDGVLTGISNGGSDVPDGAVTTCVMNTFVGLSFPVPEAGIVVVTQPIVFSPAR